MGEHLTINVHMFIDCQNNIHDQGLNTQFKHLYTASKRGLGIHNDVSWDQQSHGSQASLARNRHLKHAQAIRATLVEIIYSP
jgi:hypothetical protein